MNCRLALCTSLLSCLLLILHAEVNDDKLASVLDELLDLRSELNDLFQSPNTLFDDKKQPNAEWVVHVDGGVAEAQWLANLTSTVLVGPVRGFSNLYVFESRALQNRTENHRIRRDLNEWQPYWSELQIGKQRQKRDAPSFNDPLWQSQWEVNGQNRIGNMMIAEAWEQGYTGKDVVVSILDDGVDHSHRDLQENYDSQASYDLNDNDNDPMPTMNKFNRHGTRCAGEVAMLPNNSLCGVGVAYNSKIGGIRMLDGHINDRIEAEALSLLIHNVDILSSSWGPQDNGKTVEGPGKLATMGFQKGIREGRKGRGTIYVWASGNGGPIDDCVCDGYASSIYTFTVSGTSSSGEFPWYGERCAATLTSTFSSGTSKQKKIITIDPQNKCTNDHTGTSAAAPIAAGIIALVLEANPSLTWREVQHLAVWTSDPVPLFHTSGWQKNGAGLWSSAKFGFGLMNALEMTKMAKDFQPLGVQQNCTTTFPAFKPRKITSKLGLVLSFKLNGCQGMSNEIQSLEHVEVVADIASDARGLLSIWLESPSMQSQLLHPRMKDYSSAGFRNWPFTSVQFWGERPTGLWKLHVDQMKGRYNNSTLRSILKGVTVIFHGTASPPAHAETPKQYAHIDDSPSAGATFSSKEESVDITDMKNTVQVVRQALTQGITADAEKHLLAVNRLVRSINRMNMQTERRRRSTRIWHVDEK